MSEHEHEHEHGSAHGHEEELEHDTLHITVGGYVTGFVLSVILTAIPFWIVMSKAIASSGITALVILAVAAVQIVVHMVYFLHMNMRSEGGWTMLALMFTAVMVVITLSGSLWVMHHLKSNTMSMSPEEVRNMP